MAEQIYFGDEAEFLGSGNAFSISSVELSSSGFLVAYEDDGDSGNGTVRVGTISGTTITFGSESEFHSTGKALFSHVTTFDTNRIIVGYSDQDSGYGCINAGTVDDTTITFGNQFKYLSESGTFIRSNQEHHIITLDDGRFVVTYRDASDSGYGKAKVGTLGVDASSDLFIYAPPPDIYAIRNLFMSAPQLITTSGDLFIEGLNDVSSSELPLRIVYRLVRTGDYDP